MSASDRGRLASRAWGRRAAVSGAGVVAFFYTGTGPVEVQTPTASTRNPPGKQPAAPSTPIRGSGLRIRGSVHGWASEMLAHAARLHHEDGRRTAALALN